MDRAELAGVMDGTTVMLFVLEGDADRPIERSGAFHLGGVQDEGGDVDHVGHFSLLAASCSDSPARDSTQEKLGTLRHMTLAQRMTYITLGARDLATLRGFYGGLGWQERPGSDDEFTTYEVSGLILALYPLGRLGAEAAPGEPLPGTGWNGVTLGVNLDSEQAVDQAFEHAVRTGAEPVATPTRRDWGGYSGYIADPEGNRWELTWAPG
jgi:predicted lactoylglutathione lyase